MKGRSLSACSLAVSIAEAATFNDDLASAALMPMAVLC